MTKRKAMTDDELLAIKSALSYDQDTGVFTWVDGATRKCPGGTNAGRVRPNSYQSIGFGYREYFSHRLAWAFVNGLIPDGLEIDHIDGNQSNNAITNLRLATHSQNGQNKKCARSDNKSSGLLGVSWFKKTSKWRARIWIDGKEKSLGYFNSKLEAFEAYKAAKKLHHFTGAMA